MSSQVTSNYAGEAIQEVFTRVGAAAEAVGGGFIRIHAGTRKQVSLPRWEISNIIQNSQDIPVSGGALVHTERLLTRNDYMIYLEFNPNDFYDAWEEFGPMGSFNFGELPPDKQAELVNVIFNAKEGFNEWLGDNTFIGSLSGSTPNDKFDGFLTKATADADVVDVSGTTITAANVVAELEKVYAATRVPIRKSPNYGISVSDATLNFYWDAIAAGAAAEANPYFSITGTGPMTYKSIRILPFIGMADDRMLAGRFTDDDSSGFHMMLTFDESDIIIDRVENLGRIWAIRIDASADTQFPFGEDIVNYE